VYLFIKYLYKPEIRSADVLTFFLLYPPISSGARKAQRDIPTEKVYEIITLNYSLGLNYGPPTATQQHIVATPCYEAKCRVAATHSAG
jgi:hypothetical protein